MTEPAVTQIDLIVRSVTEPLRQQLAQANAENAELKQERDHFGEQNLEWAKCAGKWRLRAEQTEILRSEFQARAEAAERENAESKQKGSASHACYCGELPSGKKCMACQLQTAERSLKELQRERDQAHDLLDMAFADRAKESACAKCRDHTPGYRLAALVEIMERSLAELREKMRWIPVAHPPSSSGEVLTINNSTGIYILGNYLGAEGWCDEDGDPIHPTHYMFRPARTIQISREG